MKAEKVDQALQQKFVAENERLVFWHDPNGEFAEYVASGLPQELADVQVLEVARVGGLPAKLRLEREEPLERFLIYTTGEAPPAEEDWLLDIRLYSAQFHADIASLWLQELGLTSLSLREHLKARAVFLGSQERRKKLQRLITPTDDEAAIDLKMMAVLVGSQVPSAFDVLRELCHGHAKDGRFDLSQSPAVIETFEKMGLLTGFWGLMRDEFGYEAEAPTLPSLMRRIFVSELFHQVGGKGVGALEHHLLPPPGRRNAVVFLTQWRDSTTRGASHDAAASAVAREQNVKDVLEPLDLEALQQVFTFWDVERLVLTKLKERVLHGDAATDVGEVAALASRRKAGHWLSSSGAGEDDRRAVAAAYDAIEAAAELFALRADHQARLQFESPADLLAAYRDELYRFDTAYRVFWTKARPSISLGWDLLKKLATKVEGTYDHAFLQPLGVEWSRLLDEGFLARWHLDELPAQETFYAQHIRTHLAASDRKRAFVIISDAFRYEAAQELTDSINGRYRLGAELSSMLGVLPSYTALGMASLLPHDTLSFSDAGEVLVDGNSSAGVSARDRQLQTVDGMACKAQDLIGKKVDEARAFTAGARVVYIYHNVVDARGDHAATEDETFEAVEDCISELGELAAFCVNKLNAAKVWITADHGFLFQMDAPDETDKTSMSHKPEQAVKVKKRYVIGRDLGGTASAHHEMVAATRVAEGGMEFWVPRAANRFHFTGGARFVHGGAMPQEVLIPVVTVKQLRGKSADDSRTEKVSVQVLGAQHKITTPTHRFEFVQTKAVGERRQPIALRIALYEGGEAVSSVETLTFDSESENFEERKKSVKLELRGGRRFDKATPYRLILRDAETEAEIQSVPLVIDRSFDDDF